MKFGLLITLTCLAAFGATTAWAGINNEPASISVHIAPAITKKVCDEAPDLDRFSIVYRKDVGVTCQAGDFNLWILVCNGSDSLGIAGAEFGVNYDGAFSSGIDINNWTSCADLEFQSDDWPDPGSGNLVTWEPTGNCQIQNAEPFVPGSVIAIIGSLNVTVYSPDQFTILPRPASGRAKVADCGFAETDITDFVPSHLGVAGFCANGYNPCFAPIPVQETTWGKIKSQYAEGD